MGCLNATTKPGESQITLDSNQKGTLDAKVNFAVDNDVENNGGAGGENEVIVKAQFGRKADAQTLAENVEYNF
jgi:hypothetical protein